MNGPRITSQWKETVTREKRKPSRTIYMVRKPCAEMIYVIAKNPPELRVFFSLLMQIGECVSQNLIDRCFAAAGGTDQHDAVTNDHRFVELNHFLDDDFFRLKLAVDLRLINGRLHDAVVVLRKYNAGE